MNNARLATMSALEIITSKTVALIVRALNTPLGITTIIFAAIDMSNDRPQYRTFLIALVFSLTCNMIDASMIIFERWKFPSPIIRTSSQQHEMMLGCRAGPRWRGVLDIAAGVCLLVTAGGLTSYSDPLGKIRTDMGRARISLYLGITICMGHLWMCGVAVVECFLQNRAEELGTRSAG
ncbi:hypothetical protein E6O75_ATG05369 [Venturia nashicola]|uniref:Uncharacterized protein n=1 Tax=Venturia nashicola TaxID=86259 RepID=A0A4Z1NZ84_9PEZI|nr:hypothetical protein E6O75_ATG05369 [Venturia nashicola]